MTGGIAGVQARIAAIDPGWAVRQAQAASTPPPTPTIPATHAAALSFDDLVQQASGLTSVATTAGPGMAGVPYASLFAAAGERHGVDPALLAAVAETESGFDPTAVSRAGAQGLMQLMPSTAAGLGVTDPFDPAQAVDGAARLLAGHLQRFGQVELALAAYNAGPNAVARHGGVPPYAETLAYVPKVMARYQELRR